jgi:hypothetical protein
MRVVAPFLNAAPVILVLQRLLELVPDGALCIRAAHVQRHLVHAFDLRGDLGAAQDEPHLRSVAVTDRQVPACFDHVRDVMGGLAQSLLLVLHVTFIVLDQRVAANGDDCKFAHIVSYSFLCHCESKSASFHSPSQWTSGRLLPPTSRLTHRQRHDRLLGVQAVLGFIEHD